MPLIPPPVHPLFMPMDTHTPTHIITKHAVHMQRTVLQYTRNACAHQHTQHTHTHNTSTHITYPHSQHTLTHTCSPPIPHAVPVEQLKQDNDLPAAILAMACATCICTHHDYVQKVTASSDAATLDACTLPFFSVLLKRGGVDASISSGLKV